MQLHSWNASQLATLSLFPPCIRQCYPFKALCLEDHCDVVIFLGLWGFFFWLLSRVLGWVCGVLFVGLLWILPCTVLFSLFPFSIKLLITYKKKKKLLRKGFTSR